MSSAAHGIRRMTRASSMKLTFGQQMGDDSSLLQGELGLAAPAPPWR
jgi:hypothetical protein